MCMSLTGLWWKSREIVIFPFTTDLGFIGCMWMWICQDFFHIFFSFSIYTYPSYLALFLIYTTLHGNGWFWVSLPQILLDLCLQDSSSQLICFGFSSIFRSKLACFAHSLSQPECVKNQQCSTELELTNPTSQQDLFGLRSFPPHWCCHSLSRVSRREPGKKWACES